MTTRRKLALTLLAVVITAPVLMFLLPREVRAPESDGDLARASSVPDNSTKPLQPRDPPPPENEPEPSKPDVEPSDTVQSDSTDIELRWRLIDDDTGQPIANTEIRTADVVADDWHLKYVGFEVSDTPTTNAEGLVSLASGYSLGDLRKDPVYPLPFGWLPAHSLEDYAADFHVWANRGAADALEVRYTRGARVTVECLYDDGTPAENLDVSAFPLYATDFAVRGLLNDRAFTESDLLEYEDELGDAPEQEGDGITKGVKFSYSPDSSRRRFTGDLPEEWERKTNDKGVAELTGMPQGKFAICIGGASIVTRVHRLTVDGDIELRFEIPRPASLRLRVVWRSGEELEPDGYHSLHTLDGHLYIDHGGHDVVEVQLQGFAPVWYEVESRNDESPVQALTLQPGENEATVYLGHNAWCEWHAYLRVNGTALKDFSLPYSPGQSDFLNEEAEFKDAVPFRMAPGSYSVAYPDGKRETLEFVPGKPVITQLDLQIREVTFSISENLHALLTREADEYDRGNIELNVTDYFKWTQPALDLLVSALAYPTYETLGQLAPDNPVTLPVPPGIYEIWMVVPGRYYAIEAPIDLSDPARNSVLLSLEGWPGIEKYHVKMPKVGGESAEVYLNDWEWSIDHAVYNDEDWFGWFVPGGAACISYVAESSRVSVWLPNSGTYTILPSQVQGRGSLTLSDVDEDVCITAWVVWTRGGVEFAASVRGDTNTVENLPDGEARLVAVRSRLTEGVESHDCAEMSLRLSGIHQVSLADLQWKAVGRLEVIQPEQEEWSGAPKGSPVRIVHLSVETRYNVYFPAGNVLSGVDESGPLLPGTYRVSINDRGRSVIRTITIESGKTTTLDLRD